MLAVSLEDWELENSEPFLPATVLRGFERGDRLLQVTCQVSVLALEMTENAVTPQHMRDDALRSVPSVYPAQPTPLPRTTMH